MDGLLAVVVGCLYATGFYLILRRTLGQLIIGLAILGNAANLLIFSAAGTSDAAPPLAAVNEQVVPAGAADPVPQALVLTAIVIGFSILAFFVVLVYRAYTTVGSDSLDRYVWTDRLEYGERPADDTAPDSPLSRGRE